MEKKQYIQPLIEILDIKEQDELLSTSDPDIKDPEKTPDYDGTEWGDGEDEI